MRLSTEHVRAAVIGINPRKAQAIREELHRLFEQGNCHDMPGIRNSLWSSYNALTELIDHRTYRGKSERERETNRLQGIWWEPAAKIKERAWELALDLAA